MMVEGFCGKASMEAIDEVLILSAAIIDVFKHIKRGGGGGHHDNDSAVGIADSGEGFGFVSGDLDGVCEGIGECVFRLVEIFVEFAAGFADKDDA